MTIRLLLSCCGLAALLAMASCDTPGTRARKYAVVFGKLSAADQRTVLAGKVHRGMSVEAVNIAWGKPDRKVREGDGKGPTEIWLYWRQLTLKAPMDSFDRWSPGNGVWGPAVPLTLRAGFGFGGIGNEGALQTQPHLVIADDMIKRAIFTNGKLSGFEQYQTEDAPLR